jgi:hypothetical protein
MTQFHIHTLPNKHYNNKMKQDEMGKTYSTHGSYKKGTVLV